MACILALHSCPMIGTLVEQTAQSRTTVDPLWGALVISHDALIPQDGFS